MPTVSVIVTTYNRKEDLTKTIQSIIDQTYEDFELIVVDNCSNYNFFELIKNFDDNRIKAFQNQNNGIIAVNRNYGIQKATGKYLSFCDDDDVWMLNKLEKQISFIDNNHLNNKEIVLYTNCLNIYSSTKKIHTRKKKIISINDFIYGNQITFSTSFISNKNLTHQFNELPEFVTVEDYLFWWSLKIDNYEFYLITDTLVKYTVSNTSASMLNYGTNHLKSLLVLLFVAIKKKKAKLNYFHLYISIILHLIKFSIKRVKRITIASVYMLFL